jgi:hypothetical protein
MPLRRSLLFRAQLEVCITLSRCYRMKRDNVSHSFENVDSHFNALDECCLLGCINMGLIYSFWLALSLFGAFVQGTPLCDEAHRVEISSLTLSTPYGLEFTKGQYFHQDGATYGCPCLIKSCLKPCKGSV